MTKRMFLRIYMKTHTLIQNMDILNIKHSVILYFISLILLSPFAPLFMPKGGLLHAEEGRRLNGKGWETS